MDDTKKLDIREENRDSKYEQRFARFRKKINGDSQFEAKVEETVKRE